MRLHRCSGDNECRGSCDCPLAYCVVCDAVQSMREDRDRLVVEINLARLKLSYIPEHLNILGRDKPDSLLGIVALVEEAASWARHHIELRGKQND